MLQPLEIDTDTSAQPAEEDSAKRQQIVEGARKVFLAKGFDAASMNDIAKVAGVSKGTLYVYFKNKEKLFEAICNQECAQHAEQVFDFSDADNADIEATLFKIGVAFVNLICNREKVSTVRTVIAISERMPDVGRTFFESGPAQGRLRLANFFRERNATGELNVEEPEIAAAQFIESCHAPLSKPIIFNFGDLPSQAEIEKCVRIAVKTFLAAYAVR